MPFLRYLFLGFSLAFSLAPPGLAQPSPEREVAGVVRNAETGAAVPGATVVAGDRQTATDRDGRFSLRVPQGRAQIDVTAPDYFPLTTTIDLADREALDTEFVLAPRSSFSSSVGVVGASPAAPPAAVAVAPELVLRTPGALDNVFRTLQTLPGVAATEEFGSRLAVRGGAPDQNLTVMDGVEIHDPYRLFGLTSAFNPETIQRFELATGGFSVKYGDRLSSLLVVENRDGTRPERARRIGVAQHHRRQHRARRPAAARGGRLVAGDRHAARTTTWWPSGSPIRSSHVRRPAGKGRVGTGAGPHAVVVRPAQPPGRRRSRSTTTTRGESSRTTPERPGLGPLRCVLGAARPVAHRRGLFEQHIDLRRRRRVREHQPSARTRRTTSVGIANVMFDRTLAVQDTSLRQELAGRPARTWSRPAPSCIACRPTLRSRSAATAIPPPPTARARRAEPDCPTRSISAPSSRARAGCWTGGRSAPRGVARGGRCGWIAAA